MVVAVVVVVVVVVVAVVVDDAISSVVSVVSVVPIVVVVVEEDLELPGKKLELVGAAEESILFGSGELENTFDKEPGDEVGINVLTVSVGVTVVKDDSKGDDVKKYEELDECVKAGTLQWHFLPSPIVVYPKTTSYPLTCETLL